LTKETGVDLLADAFLAARARDRVGTRAGGRRARAGGAAVATGFGRDVPRLARRRRARPHYADADLFLFCSQTDTFGQVVLEAQASGLAVVAVDAGGPSELIADARSGLLCPPRPSALADAVTGLAGSRAARERLARGGLAAVRERTWEASLAALGNGWRRALAVQREAEIRAA
jgi:glycosyltransferase involved in cell wall biosynthesis